MKYYREYDFGHGITMRPETKDGEKAFHVFRSGKLVARAETFEQAKDMAFSLSMERHKHKSRLLFSGAFPSA